MQPNVQIKRHWAFAIPFFTATLPDSEALNQRLIAEFNASRDKHAFSHLHENRHENTYVDYSLTPSARPIFEFAEKAVGVFAGKPVVVPKQPEPGGLPWFWFNETKNRGGVTSLHNHWTPWSFFSGCYYLKVPPNSGNLVFSRKRSQTVAHGLTLQHSDFFSDIEIPPHPGMLILFPSWLDHCVRPNETDESRISLAFNLCLADGSKANFTTGAVVNG